MAQESLRIVLALADPGDLQAWVLRLIEGIETDPALVLCGIVGPVPARKPEQAKPFYRLLNRMERAIGARRPAVDVEAAQQALADVPIIPADDEAGLAQMTADVLLDLSGNHGLTLSTSAAKHGVWFTDVTSTISGAAGIKPLLEHRPVSPINLYRRTTNRPVPTPIACGAVDSKFIAARNAWFLDEKSVALILRELRRCARDGRPGKIAGQSLFVAPSVPTNRETARYLVGMLSKLAGRLIEAVARRLRFRPGMFHLRFSHERLGRFSPNDATEIRPRGNCYHADPFLWQSDGETWCFFERYHYASSKGDICAGRIENDQLVDIRCVLSPGYHLSFPFLFEHGGDLFMMPESCANQRLEIWRCANFPDQWELHGTALEGTMIADSMIAQVDETWWLFTNIATDPFGDMSSELHLYRINGPDLAELEPHPLNPVVFDSRTARNAGRLHRRDGALIRPAQDNSHDTYGYGLQLMRIEELSMDDYREYSTRHITPGFGRGIIGCHHVDQLGDQLVFDVCKRFGGFA